MKVHEIAHRGWSDNSPENTRTAFMSVLNGKYAGLAYGIECDVQMTKDGKVIVAHDIALGRMSYGDGFIADHTYDELSCFDFGSAFSASFSSERIMLLSELLELINGRSFLCIELKNPGNIYPSIVDAVIKVLADYPRKEFIVESFNHAAIRILKEKEPSISTGLIFHDETEFLPEQCQRAKCDWASMLWTMASKERIAELQKNNILPMLWTMNEEWQYAWLSKKLSGCGGDLWIATDVPGASRLYKNRLSTAK